MNEVRRGKCSVCGVELSVTAAGVVRIHGYARGEGNTEEARCPGSSKAPVDAETRVTCLYCAGSKCEHCGGTGAVTLEEAVSYDAVLVVERAVRDKPLSRAPSLLAITAVEELVKYGFIQQVEEAPNPEGTGWAGANVKAAPSSDRAKALEAFYAAWVKETKGPVKPALAEAKKKVEASAG